MTFPRIRPMGSWIGVIATAELEAIDENLSNAIDGAAGGAYAPSALLTIGGAGVRFEGPFAVANHGSFLNGITVAGFTSFFLDDVQVTGDVECTGTVTADGGFGSSAGGAILGGNVACAGVSCSGTVTADGGFGSAGGAILGGNLAAASVNTGTLQASGATTLLGTLACALSATFSGGIGVTAQSSLVAPMLTTGAGRVVRRIANVTDTDMQLSVQTADDWYEGTGVLTDDRTFTLMNSGAQNGDRIRVRLNNAHSVNFVAEGGGAIRSDVGGSQRIVEFVRIGGNWAFWSELAVSAV